MFCFTWLLLLLHSTASNSYEVTICDALGSHFGMQFGNNLAFGLVETKFRNLDSIFSSSIRFATFYKKKHMIKAIDFF